MPRLKTSTPQYRKHRASGQAVVTLNGQDFYLGPYGSRISRAEYDRIVSEWLQNGRQIALPISNEVTLAEAVVRYWRYVQKRHVKHGKPTDEQANIRASLRPLVHLYGRSRTQEIGPTALRIVQEAMVDSGLARSTINERVARIKRMFKWFVAEELVPVQVYQSLCTVEGLRRGQTAAKETEPVRPVDDAVVEATLPFLPEVVADMVRVQRLTGCRPSEVCALRPCDLDRSEHVWRYRLDDHKTEHHGHKRIIFIGPQAQAVLLKYLVRDANSHCFSPADSESKRLAARHANRSTPLSCGNRPGSNRATKPKRRPREKYDVDSYRRAILRACKKAFPLPASLVRQRIESPAEHLSRLTDSERRDVQKHLSKYHWSPNRLRHAAGTEIRKRFGIESAQVVLGHARANVTEIYAEKNFALAAQVALEVG